MKPDWNDAPEWATCLAMDADGVWCWYEEKPKLKKSNGIFFSPLKVAFAGNGVCWFESLEVRP